MLTVPISREYWAQQALKISRSSVWYLEVEDSNGYLRCGTCFHVGGGVFVTARHVVNNKIITKIGLDDSASMMQINRRKLRDGIESTDILKDLIGRPFDEYYKIKSGPFFHSNKDIDIACFTVDVDLDSHLMLGAHIYGEDNLILHGTLVLGYPPIPFTNQPFLVASLGEINAVIHKRAPRTNQPALFYPEEKFPYFIISTMARGGFSGGPALISYNDYSDHGKPVVLGVITESLINGEKSKYEELGYFTATTVAPI